MSKLAAYKFETIHVLGEPIKLSESSEEAWITLQGGDIRYRYDGDNPTALEGHVLYQGHTLRLSGQSQVAGFRAVACTDKEGILSVSYERY